MPFYHVVIKLLLAVLFGGIVGYEREHKSRPAGLRTHVLVCIGAALVQIISIDFYYQYRGEFKMDPMRLGAQVISGIGFLGAGAILKEGVNIRGLTTAASIWVVACIGITVGSGLYLEALFATIAVFIALEGFKNIELKMIKNRNYVLCKIIAYNNTDVIRYIMNLIDVQGNKIIRSEVENLESGQIQLRIIFEAGSDYDQKRFLREMVDVDGIIKVTIG